MIKEDKTLVFLIWDKFVFLSTWYSHHNPEEIILIKQCLQSKLLRQKVPVWTSVLNANTFIAVRLSRIPSLHLYVPSFLSKNTVTFHHVFFSLAQFFIFWTFLEVTACGCIFFLALGLMSYSFCCYIWFCLSHNLIGNEYSALIVTSPILSDVPQALVFNVRE